MSLQVWLPMTKDLRQQGLSDVTVVNNGATFNSSGKLGGCYSFDGTDDNLSFTPNVDGLENLSIAFWACPAAATPSGSFFSLERLTYWQITFYNDYIGIRDNSIGYSGTRKNFSTGTYVANTWTHIAVTYSKGILKIYRDGSLLSTNSVGGTKLNTEINNARIGSAVQSGYYHAGKISDVRIYDHCLSPMEVKRISQGLILHYPLNNMGFGQENLAKNSNLGWNSTAYNVIQGEMYEDWVVGDTYTITIKGTPSSGCKFGLWSDAGNSHMCFFYNKIKDNIWIATATCSASQNTTKFSVWDSPSNNPTHNAHIEWIKIEKGSIATPWSPAPSDDLATQMGLNSNIEYDSSGYCHNGTKTGTFTYTTDSPKYSVSAEFDGVDSAIVPSIYSSTTRHSELTTAAWVKRTSDDANWHYYWHSQGISLDIRSYNSVNNYYNVNWTHATDSSSSGAGWVNNIMPLNTWVHDVWVFDHGVMKHYVNGELVGTNDRSSTGTYILGDVTGLMGGQTSTSNMWKGGLSDLRIYATALSATDVKSLYQNSATIDADGTIHGAIR